MKPSDKIKQFIINEEGFRADAYQPLNTDRFTIGYGSTFYSNGDPVQYGDHIDEPTARNLINAKLDNLAVALSRFTNPKCTQQQFDAVLSLCYNVGLQAFSNSNTGSLYAGGVDISNRFELWDESAGRVIPGLLTRRQKEKAIYDSGTY